MGHLTFWCQISTTAPYKPKGRGWGKRKGGEGGGIMGLYIDRRINAPINCKPHHPHLGIIWGNGRGFA